MLTTSAQGKHPEKTFTKMSKTDEHQLIKTGKIGSFNLRLPVYQNYTISQDEIIVGAIASAT